MKRVYLVLPFLALVGCAEPEDVVPIYDNAGVERRTVAQVGLRRLEESGRGLDARDRRRRAPVRAP